MFQEMLLMMMMS